MCGPTGVLGPYPDEHKDKPQNGDYMTMGLEKESSSEAKSFTIGLTPPRLIKAGKPKKDQGGGHKRMKSVQKALGKENRYTKEGNSIESGQPDVTDVVMESFEVGEKCKEQLPLMEVSHSMEYNKKPKLEKEVQVLGHIMAQQLG